MKRLVRVAVILFIACFFCKKLCAQWCPLLEKGSGMPHAEANIADTGNYVVRNIVISGNKKTRNPIIIREIAVEPGTPYTGDVLMKKIRQTREQLMNTTLFIDVAINEMHVDENQCDIQILVKERWYVFPLPFFKVVDRNWNVWIKEHDASLERTQYGVKFDYHNFSGHNDKLQLWVLGGYTQQLEFKYNLPYADKKMEKGFTVGMNYGRMRELNYKSDSNKQVFQALPNFGRQYFKAEGSFSYRKGSRQRIYARSIFGYEKIDSQFFHLNPNYLAGRTQASYLDLQLIYQYFNVDYIPFPLRGWYIDVFGTKRFSKTIGMMQVGGRALATWRFLPKSYINFQTAFVYTFPGEQPYFNQKLMGYGSLYMQGLEYNVLDGTFGVMGRTTLRRELFGFTLKGPEKWKAYSRIPFKVYGKTYGNIGYAYNKNPGTNFMNNQFLHTAGAGLEISTIYDMVLKLEYSWNQFGNKGFFIHTSADF